MSRCNPGERRCHDVSRAPRSDPRPQRSLAVDPLLESTRRRSRRSSCGRTRIEALAQSHVTGGRKRAEQARKKADADLRAIETLKAKHPRFSDAAAVRSHLEETDATASHVPTPDSTAWRLQQQAAAADSGAAGERRLGDVSANHRKPDRTVTRPSWGSGRPRS